MEINTKKYCHTCTYSLPSDSLLRKLCIKDILPDLDIDKSIPIFIDDTYELLIKVDRDGKLNQLIYKTDLKEKTDRSTIKDESLNKIIPSLRCLQFAFIGLQRQNLYIHSVKDDNEIYVPSIEILNYETGEKESLIGGTARGYAYAYAKVSLEARHLSLEDICRVLKVRQEISIHINIDEYIERFLSIENLSNDPVLHLITLYSLYEYIKGSNGGNLYNYFEKVNKNNSNISLEKVFRSTRHLVAHGFAGGKGSDDKKKTAEILKEFLGAPDSKGCYSFDRYNSKHINLINEVISESQTVIEKYLKHKLKTD